MSIQKQSFRQPLLTLCCMNVYMHKTTCTKHGRTNPQQQQNIYKSLVAASSLFRYARSTASKIHAAFSNIYISLCACVCEWEKEHMCLTASVQLLNEKTSASAISVSNRDKTEHSQHTHTHTTKSKTASNTLSPAHIWARKYAKTGSQEWRKNSWLSHSLFSEHFRHLQNEQEPVLE